MLSAKLIFLVALGQTPEPKPDAAALVEKLGSASYAEREASKSLENLGSKALPALRSSLKSKDPEVRYAGQGHDQQDRRQPSASGIVGPP